MNLSSLLRRVVTIALLLGLFFALGLATRFAVRVDPPAAPANVSPIAPLLLAPLVALPALHAWLSP